MRTMRIPDSGSLRNEVRLRSILFAGLVHLAFSVFTLGAWLVVFVITGLVSYNIAKSELKSISEDATKFKKSFPFRYYGHPIGEFLHVFHCEKNIGVELIGAIKRILVEQTPVTELTETIITDVDPDLRDSERRQFLLADAGRTVRGTSIALLLRLSAFGKMRAVQWWVTVGGYVDRDKLFNFVAYSPISFWFWIIPYLRRDYDVLASLRTIYSASYNDIDIINRVRCLHGAVFNALTEELEKNGVDTADIKVQRMQVMNIAISGGRVSMGNVVQGAMNNVAASMPGVAK